MYAFVDRPVESLCDGGRFLLWAMRGWTLSAARGRCPPQALHRGFAGLGAAPALPDFHVALALLASDTRTPLVLKPMACPRIGEDEAVLLGLWRAVGAGDAAGARATLALLVADTAAGPILAALTAAAARLDAAGYDLSGLAPLSSRLSGNAL